MSSASSSPGPFSDPQPPAGNMTLPPITSFEPQSPTVPPRSLPPLTSLGPRSDRGQSSSVSSHFVREVDDRSVTSQHRPGPLRVPSPMRYDLPRADHTAQPSSYGTTHPSLSSTTLYGHYAGASSSSRTEGYRSMPSTGSDWSFVNTNNGVYLTFTLTVLHHCLYYGYIGP